MMDGGADVSTVHHKDVHGYFVALQQYFNNAETKHDRSNSPRAQKARAKLLKLSASQFYELSTDVYDELQRRINEDQSQPEYLLPRATFHMKRNQARQKLANLSRTRFNDLVDDILFEIKRRGYNVAPDASERSKNGKDASNKRTGSDKGIENHNSRNTKSSASDGSFSQVPPTATIQTSKVIPQKASIDWSSEEEDNEGDTGREKKNKSGDLPVSDNAEHSQKSEGSDENPEPPHFNGLQQPNTTPLLSATESCHYGDLIDSPAPTEIGNQLHENTSTSDLSITRDLNSSPHDEASKSYHGEENAELPSEQTRINQLNDEIDTLKRENASLRQNRSLGGFTSNENFERDLNSLSTELGTLSVENEQLREKVSELEFKAKNMVPKQLAPLKTKRGEPENNLFDKGSLAKYAAEDGSIPFESVEEFHSLVQKLFECLQYQRDDIGRTLFERLSRLSHTVSQLLVLVDVPEFRDEVLLLKASLSHTITAVRYYAVYGALLPKISVQAAISELAFAFCNLVRSSKIKGDKETIATLGRRTAVLSGDKDELTPQTPEINGPTMNFKNSFLHNPSKVINFGGAAQDDVSPVKPLKITQKANMSPKGKTPTPRKFSTGLLFGSMVNTKSPSAPLNGTSAGHSFDKARELNGVSPTASQRNGSNANLQLGNVDLNDKSKKTDAGFSFERERGSLNKDVRDSEAAPDENKAKIPPNSEADKSKTSITTSRGTTGAAVFPTPPSTASEFKNEEKALEKHSGKNAEPTPRKGEEVNGKTNAALNVVSESKDSGSQNKQSEEYEAGRLALSHSSFSKSQGASGVKEGTNAKSSPSLENDKSKGSNSFEGSKSKSPKSPTEQGKSTPNRDAKSRRKSEKHNYFETNSKRNERSGKSSQGDSFDKQDHQESKLKKSNGKSFTDKLRNFANNAGIGLRVDKQHEEIDVKDDGMKSDESKPVDKTKAPANDSKKDLQKSEAGLKMPSNKSNSVKSLKDSDIPPSSAKKNVNEKSSSQNNPNGENESLFDKSAISEASQKTKKGNTSEDEVGQSHKEISNGAGPKTNGVTPSVTLNDGDKETDITPKDDAEDVGAKKLDVAQNSEEVPQKLPNFYFNNIPVPPPTNALLTDKLKKSFADIPSEDENDEGSDMNNSPYMSDDGSSFHAFKQTWRQENTGRNSPLVQQQNFHKGDSSATESSGGVNLSKANNLEDSNNIGNSVNNKNKGEDAKGHTISDDVGLNHYDSRENPKYSNSQGSLQAKKSDLIDTKEELKPDPKGSLESNDSTRNVPLHNKASSAQGNSSKVDSSAKRTIPANQDDVLKEKSKTQSNSAHEAIGNQTNNQKPTGNSAPTNDKSSSKSGNKSVANENPYNKSRGYDPSGSPALPGVVEQKSQLNGKQSSNGDDPDDLNADPAFMQNGDVKKTPSSKPALATTPQLQPIKLSKSFASRGDDYTRSPGVPKTPGTKSPMLKTPASKGSAARSPTFGSPATRDEDYDDDRELSFDVDAFDIANPDNTLSELLLYLEHQSLQVIATIQSLLTSIKQPQVTKGNLRKESNAINQVIRQMVDATSISMNQSRNASLKEHGSWVVKSLEDCHLRMTTLCQLKRDGDFTDKSGDNDFADKHFKQRLAGIAFDVAKCTKELVKTVEEASLKEEIAFLNSRLN